MEDYQLIKPSPLLAPYIKHYWFLKITNIADVDQVRTVPTGHICLIFHRGKRIFSASQKLLQPRGFLSGHEKAYTDLEYAGLIDMICVVFQPARAGAFFDVPMSAVNGLKVDVNDLEDEKLTDLQKALEDAPTNQYCVLLIEQFLLKRIRTLADYNLKRIDSAIHLINSQETHTTQLAEASCLSPRQFNRVFREYLGTSPKEFQRIVRFQKALFLLQSQPDINLAQLAIACGYYDQPHLIKEFKKISGYTPVEYISVCDPFSDYFS